MLDKNFSTDYIDISYNEVKDLMRHTISTTDFLEKKAHNTITICLAVFFSVCGFIFAKYENISLIIILSSLCVLSGASIALFFLYKAFQAREFYPLGDMMDDILEEDKYYHDNIGVKIYLITRYKWKCEKNITANNKKGIAINKAIKSLYLGGVVGVFLLTVIYPIYRFACSDF